MKNGVETLAKMFKDRENATGDFVVFGKIIELPNLKIQFTSKIILTKEHIKSLIDLYKQDIDGRYVYKGREVAMIPYRGNNRYLVLGVTENGSSENDGRQRTYKKLGAKNTQYAKGQI